MHFAKPSPSIPEHSHLSLPDHPSSAGLARRHIARACDGFDRELRDVAMLLTSELVGNAVRHTGGAIELVVRWSADRLRVEVHDHSTTHPTPISAGPLHPHGRGLMLVERLAARWGTSPSEMAAKHVWFELRLPISR